MSPGTRGSGIDSLNADSAQVERGSVPGERGAAVVSGVGSLHSRLSATAALGLMILLGAAILAGYYSSVRARHALPLRTDRARLLDHAGDDVPLPPLPRMPVPRASADEAPMPLLDPQPRSAAADPRSDPASLGDRWPPASREPPRLDPQAGSATSPGQVPSAALERRLSGAAFVPDSAAAPALPESAGAGERSKPVPAASDGLAGLMQPFIATPVKAGLLTGRQFLLGRGAFIDCTLETAIDSTLPGMTTCITATDTFSVDGDVVLLERGTKLIGETRGQVQQGMARVFVLWTEARTPSGVVVPLDSPGTDELGRSGLAGVVDKHFWDRFGAAILVSTLDVGVQSAMQSSSRNAGAVIYNPGPAESVMADVVRGSADIPPTVRKRNGDRIQVFVARDVDFASVYALRKARSS